MSRYALNLPTQLKQDAERLAAAQGVSLNQFILWAVAEKVGALGQPQDDPRFPHVTYRRGGSGAFFPALRGTNMRVRTVVIASKVRGMSPAEIADDYGFITEAQVKDALAFYEAHRGEIDATIEAEAELAHQSNHAQAATAS